MIMTVAVTLSELFFDSFSDLPHIDRRLKAGFDIALAVNEKLCKIPFYIRLVAELFVVRVRVNIQKCVF